MEMWQSIKIKNILTYILRLVLLIDIVSHVNGYQINRADDGFPAGFIPDCPGSTKNITVNSKIISKLYVVIVEKTHTGTKRRRHRLTSATERLISDPGFDPRRKTMVFISGLFDSTNFPFPTLLGDIYAARDYNTLLIDTNRLTTYVYPLAARLSRVAGEQTGRMLARLYNKGYSNDNIELVGLSLGGQTISFTAKTFTRLTGKKLSRVTGLDPSSPCFRNLPPEQRLDMSDAQLVDVIHTNIDGYGIASPVGHINFYVNGGEYQPSGIEEIPCLTSCSHIRSLFIWLASIEYPEKFIGIKCDSVQQARDLNCFDRQPLETNLMGPKTNRTATGIFYLGTTNSFPFHMGADGLAREKEVFKSRLSELNKDDKLKS